MYAHITTYRHAGHDEVAREMEFAISYPNAVVISDQTARAIASWYSSPNQNTRNLLALSQGNPFDTENLRVEIEVHMADSDSSNGDDTYSDSDYGNALADWLATLEAILSE